MKLICIGDSLTYGYGVPRRDTWVALTAARTGLELVNAGVNGDTTGGMLARFRIQVLEQRPGAVLIMGGGNDMMTGCPNCIPQSNIMGMAHQALGAGVAVLVGTPIPYRREGIREDWAAFAGGNLKEESVAEYRAWLFRFGAAFGVPVVDFWPAFARLGSGEGYYLDGLHPTKEGHRLMAEVLCGALARAGLWRSPEAPG